jgi:hypothetical protein
VGIRVLGGFPSEASVSTGLGFSFFFAPFFFLGVFHKKILRQDRLGTPIAQPVDLQHSPFFVSGGRPLPLSKVDRRRRLIAQGLMTPLVIVQVISTTPILESVAKSAIRGIRGTAGQCGCIPRS